MRYATEEPMAGSMEGDREEIGLLTLDGLEHRPAAA
jgi:hypothetical protein